MEEKELMEIIFRKLTAGQCSSILDELEDTYGCTFRTTRRLLCFCKPDLQLLLSEKGLLEKNTISKRYCPYMDGCCEHRMDG